LLAIDRVFPFSIS